MEGNSSNQNVLERYRMSQKQLCRSCSQRLKADLKQYHKECNRFCFEVHKVTNEIEQLQAKVIQLRTRGNIDAKNRKETESKCQKLRQVVFWHIKRCRQLSEEGKRLQSILQALARR